MKCTVLLPVYGAGAPLHVAISSILAQDERDFEFLIIDDCSPDRSAVISREYAARDNRIRTIFHVNNQGLAATLNEGVRSARTELVVRMDQDDEALPSRIRTQLRYMETHPAIAVAGSFVYHMGRNRQYDRLVTLPTEPDEVARALPLGNCVYHPSVIFRRSCILGLGGYRSEFKNAEDYDLWLRASRSYSIANIPDPLLRYRFSPGGMTLGKKWQQMFYVQMALLSNRFPELNYEDLRAATAVEIDKLDKQYFLEQVAIGTVEELVRLHLWRDAVRVFAMFSRQIDRTRRWGLAKRTGTFVCRELGKPPGRAASATTRK